MKKIEKKTLLHANEKSRHHRQAIHVVLNKLSRCTSVESRAMVCTDLFWYGGRDVSGSEVDVRDGRSGTLTAQRDVPWSEASSVLIAS